MLRYSLGSLFLALLYLSVGCAALVNATGIWPHVAITLTLAMLGIFSLRAAFGDERRRVFAIAFSATGWLYMLLVFSSVTSLRPYLLTEAMMNQLYTTLHAERIAGVTVEYPTYATATTVQGVQPVAYAPPAPLPGPMVIPPAPVYPTPNVLPNASAFRPIAIKQPLVDPRQFASIGHSLWTIIVAFAAGTVAQVFYSRRQHQADVATRG